MLGKGFLVTVWVKVAHYRMSIFVLGVRLLLIKSIWHG
jgi:hypothetical protein